MSCVDFRTLYVNNSGQSYSRDGYTLDAKSTRARSYLGFLISCLRGFVTLINKLLSFCPGMLPCDCSIEAVSELRKADLGPNVRYKEVIAA